MWSASVCRRLRECKCNCSNDWDSQIEHLFPQASERVDRQMLSLVGHSVGDYWSRFEQIR